MEPPLQLVRVLDGQTSQLTLMRGRTAVQGPQRRTRSPGTQRRTRFPRFEMEPSLQSVLVSDAQTSQPAVLRYKHCG